MAARAADLLERMRAAPALRRAASDSDEALLARLPRFIAAQAEDPGLRLRALISIRPF